VMRRKAVRVTLELDCYELSDIYMSLQLALMHGAHVREIAEKIAEIFKKECTGTYDVKWVVTEVVGW